MGRGEKFYLFGVGGNGSIEMELSLFFSGNDTTFDAKSKGSQADKGIILFYRNRTYNNTFRIKVYYFVGKLLRNI